MSDKNIMRKNPFHGKGEYPKFMRLIYKRLMGSKWFSHADVMADFLKLDSAAELPYSISKCPYNGELRKAFLDIIKLIKEKTGKECVETRGNNRCKEFRYIGADDNPLEDFQNASVINNVSQYAQFCEDSAGLLPSSWLRYFLEDTCDLLKINRRKQSGEQIIFSSTDRELTNIELLPNLYETIRDKKVLKIDYKPYDEESITIIFHPHLLKEYNGRWFLFGHAEGKKPEFGYNLALDRIINFDDIEKSLEKNYIRAPKGYYTHFFKDIVGVSHKTDVKPAEIIIRATTHNIYKLTETKKIHHSQRTIKPFGQHNDGEYGEFELFVEPNNEFIGRILQMGDGLVVVSPIEIREIFRKRIVKMVDLYKD